MELEKIKKILMAEELSYSKLLHEKFFRERAQFYLDHAIERVLMIQDKEDVNKFIWHSRGMTTQEWIDSLPKEN